MPNYDNEIRENAYIIQTEPNEIWSSLNVAVSFMNIRHVKIDYIDLKYKIENKFKNIEFL
jgi:hypothetical protein